MELPEEDASVLAKRSAIQAVMRNSSLSPSERSVRIQSILRGEGGLLEVVVANNDDSSGSDYDIEGSDASSSSSSGSSSSSMRSEYSEEEDDDESSDGDDSKNNNNIIATTLLPPTFASFRTKASRNNNDSIHKCDSMVDKANGQKNNRLSVQQQHNAEFEGSNYILIDILIQELTASSNEVTRIDLSKLNLTNDEVLPLLELLCNNNNNNNTTTPVANNATTAKTKYISPMERRRQAAAKLKVSTTGGQVTILNLRCNNLGQTATGCSALSSVIHNNTTLLSIDISSNNIGDAGCTELSRSLPYNTTLQILYMEDNNIGIEGAVALAESFTLIAESTNSGNSTSSSSSHLREINLNNNHIGDEGACALFRALGGTTTTATTTAAAAAAAASMSGSTITTNSSCGSSTKNFPAITTLYLKCNLISNGGATELASTLLDNNILHIIDMSNNHITNIGALDILKVLEINDTLEKLYLDGNLDIDDNLLCDIQYALESTNRGDNNVEEDDDDSASEDYDEEDDDNTSSDDDDDENDIKSIDEDAICDNEMTTSKAPSSYVDEEERSNNNSLEERIAAKLRGEEMKVGQTWRREDNTTVFKERIAAKVRGEEMKVGQTWCREDNNVSEANPPSMKAKMKVYIKETTALVASAPTTANPSSGEITGVCAMITDKPNESDNVIAQRRAIHTVMQDQSLDGVERNKRIQDIMSGSVVLAMVNSEEFAATMMTVIGKDEKDESDSNECDIDIEACRTMSASINSSLNSANPSLKGDEIGASMGIRNIPDELILPPSTNSTPVIRNGSRGDTTGRHKSLPNNTAVPLNDIYTRQKSTGNNGMRSTIADKWKQCMMAPHPRSHDNLLDIILAHQYRLSLTMPPQQSYFRVVALVFFSRIVDGTIQSERNYVVGTNDEPHSISGSICAERAALMQLRFVPDLHEITKVVIVTDEVETISPGMLCREFMASHDRIPWEVPIILGRSVCKITGYDISGEAVGDVDKCFDKTKNDTLRNVDKEIWADVGSNKNFFTPRDFFGVQVTLKELFPYPSLYSRLSANEAVRFGEDCIRRNVVTDPLLRIKSKKATWKHSSYRSNRWSDDDTVRTHRQDEFDVSLLSGIFDEQEEVEDEDEIGNIHSHISSNGKSSNATASEHRKQLSLKSDEEELVSNFMPYHLSSRTIRMSERLRPSQRREKLMRLATEVTTLEIVPQKYIHPIRYGAAVLFNDGTVMLASQKVALEYGCSLDAVGQLASAIDRKANITLQGGHSCSPMMLVQCDQFGIAHPPFAQGRAYLSERGYGDCKILVHQLKKGNNQLEGEISHRQIINNDENARECDIDLRLIEVNARDLAPAPPDMFGQLITKNHS